jgi:hypothetical protein
MGALADVLMVEDPDPNDLLLCDITHPALADHNSTTRRRPSSSSSSSSNTISTTTDMATIIMTMGMDMIRATIKDTADSLMTGATAEEDLRINNTSRIITEMGGEAPRCPAEEGGP